jgi:hypothetical protein
METNNQNNKPGINFTLIIIVALVCVTALVGLILLKGGTSAKNTTFNVLKSEVPVFISWRETKMAGHTQVALIWPKLEAQLPLRLTCVIEVSSTGKKYEREVIVESFHTGKEPLEVGGWLDHHFVPGDRIILSHRNYLNLESTCSANR